MNLSMMTLELGVIGLALSILLIDLWTPVVHKPKLGYLAAAGLLVLLLVNVRWTTPEAVELPAKYAFGKMFVADSLALFFKNLFLIAAILVLLMSIEFAAKIEAGISEFYAFFLFALVGMLFAASANDFILMFVALELITITFYILTSFQRARLLS